MVCVDLGRDHRAGQAAGGRTVKVRLHTRAVILVLALGMGVGTLIVVCTQGGVQWGMPWVSSKGKR
jgi:hypothetical protein